MVSCFDKWGIAVRVQQSLEGRQACKGGTFWTEPPYY